jgi:uncharacterized protein (DUF58 family)
VTPEILERIRGLELDVVGRIEGLLQGDRRGLLPGPGGEAGDARPYAPGDDVRRIDWNVTARTRRPYVRDTTADRELETTLVVDVSGSMLLGSGGTEKWEVAMAAAAVYGFLTDRAGDRVGALVMGSRPAAIAARPGRSHVYAILSAIDQASREPASVALASALDRVARLRRRRGLVVVISDFLDESPWWRPLRALAAAHDVVAVHVTDPVELDLTASGVVRVEDPETGDRTWVDTSNASVRRRYADEGRRRTAGIERELRLAGVSRVALSTHGDWVGALVAAVLGRRRTLAAAGRSR